MDRSGIPAYLVYYYHGEIKVKHGNINGVFFPDNERAWHTKIPDKLYKVSSRGKILVLDKEDIPMAKRAIYNHYLKRIDEVSSKAVASLRNIQKMVREENYERI